MKLVVKLIANESEPTEIWSKSGFGDNLSSREDLQEEAINVSISNAIGRYFPHGFGLSIRRVLSDGSVEKIYVHCSGRSELHELSADGRLQIVDKSVPDRDFIIEIHPS